MTTKTSAELLTEISDNFRLDVPYSDQLMTRLNTLLTNLVDSSVNTSLLISGAGVPVDYTDGSPPASGEGVTPPGALYIDTTNGLVYRNSGTQAEPLWTALADAS